MTVFNIEIEGVRGDAVTRYASLADKSPEALINEWVKDKVNNVTVQALRAASKTWDEIAEVLECSNMQARRIYAKGIDMPVVSKHEIQILEQYVGLIQRIDEITFPVPSFEDFDKLQRYRDAINAISANEDETLFPVPTEEEVERVERYAKATAEVD